MKQVLFIALSLLSISAFAQQNCENIVKECEALLSKDSNIDFVSDGQVYTVFLDREKAEFKTTFYGGTTYRLAASAGSDDDYVIYTIRDPEGQILFSNKHYKNAPFWDFKIHETLPVTIEAELDPDMKNTGCVVMMIGFQK